LTGEGGILVLSRDHKGETLEELHKGDEDLLLEEFPDTTHSLVVGIQSGDILFIYNKWKNTWELPGGVREPGETPRECAIRELFEETAKRPIDLRFHSVIEWRLGPDQHTEFGALYVCGIEGEALEMNTEETGRTLFWDLSSDIGPVAELDRFLARRVLSGL
jgi:8-oxo-dGTP diphosphatase